MSEDPGAAPQDGQAQPSWTEGFDDDLKGYVENKGFKDPSALAESYRNLEKLRGVPEDQLIRWPDDPTEEGALDPVFEKLGRPASPDEYENVLGDGFNDEVYKAAAETAHKLGLGNEQFKGLQQVLAGQAQAIEEAREAEATAAFDAWKEKNPGGFEAAAKVMADLGMNEDQVAAMLSGDKTAIYDFAAKVGAARAEAPVVQGDPSGAGPALSPQAAAEKARALMNDEAFRKQYFHEDKAVRQPAIDRITKLHEIAAQGKG